MERSKICRFKWQALQWWCRRVNTLSFTLKHRIHPLYMDERHRKLHKVIDGVALATAVDFEQ